MYKKALFWFRRDLRVHDNVALSRALKEAECVYCVFVFDQNILQKLKDKNDRRVVFIWQSLNELRQELQNYGSELIIVYGDPIVLIPAMAEKVDAECVFTNRDYEAYALHRDDTVQACLNLRNRHFATEKDHIVFESSEVKKANGEPYTVFTPYKKAWLNALNTQFDSALQEHSSKKYFQAGKLAHIDELIGLKDRLREAGCELVEKLNDIGFVEVKLAIETGMSGAQAQLTDFLRNKVKSYKEGRNFLSMKATSELSPHLRFGTISIRQCFREAFAMLAERRSSSDHQNIECWISELIWREFYSMILQAFPFVEREAFRPEYKNLLWRTDDKLFRLWQEGLTGYPVVDAAMRQLKQTGQMHNRARMIAASFLTKDLLIDWQRGEEHFARYLLDFDLASNNGGWQWSSSTGTDAAPYFRVFNPSLQGAKFDPQAEYIKQYVPELKDLTAEEIHEMRFSLNTYPKPIVKHHEVKQAVLDLFKTAKAKKM